ncbi:MAG TPA: RNA methyltransferase [Acidimicrobiales bacterium]|nr:RNA methyltransferase [Acidimicrobiales bacterium]
MEGPTLVREAIVAGAPIEAVFVAPGAGDAAADAWARGMRVYDLADGVLERVAGTVTPQPVLAIVGMVDVELGALAGPGADPRPVVVCADVRDPGNLGTVLRSAEAAGAAGVVCCDGTVDAYNPKSVRASAGALFHVPLVVGGEPADVLDALRATGRCAIGAAARRGAAYTEQDLSRSVLVIGNESNGLPAGLDDHVDGFVHIPMEGRSESLNVGMACTALCFEAARQRRGR